MITFSEKQNATVVCTLLLTTMLIGCAHNGLLMRKETENVIVAAAQTHQIYAVHVVRKSKELLVYGRVKKIDGFCLTPGHVDIAVLSRSGSILYSAGIPCTDRISHRRGIYGANFKATIPFILPADATVYFAFHGDNCHSGETFDVADNRAIPKPAK
jgi:hypothetical protein